MDAQQWTDHLNAVPLTSDHVDEFAYVSECPCGTGGPCCQVKLQMQITNRSLKESQNVYTDDIVSSDERVLPVHRTFNIISMKPLFGGKGIAIETSSPHTFSDGDLVTVLDSVARLPRFCKASQCRDSGMILQPLFESTSEKISPNVLVDFVPLQKHIDVKKIGESLGHITNRLLLYTLGPGQTISWSAIARKGTAGTGTMREETEDSGRKRHIKWSPVTVCYYRPLARDMKLDSSKLKTREQAKAFLMTCPKGVFDIEDTSVKSVVIKNGDDCDLCRSCENWATENNLTGLIELPKRKYPEWTQFVVKSSGSIDAYSIVQKAISHVREKLILISGAAGAQLVYPSLKSY
jgi:NAD-dependent dihydropyrimidine dehydrogenase PreA subunit